MRIGEQYIYVYMLIYLCISFSGAAARRWVRT